jgi:hypothetical protein
MPAAPSLLIVPYRSKTGKLYSQIPTSGAGDFTVTRDTTARRFNSAGLIASVASGIPRLDYYTSGGTAGCPALLVEPAATNLVLHSRDLTNAVWSGTNVTRVKNAVGADGVASGATTLTATAASGTVLQALSHASQSRVFSAYVRRVTGTGAIQMTTNNGTTWTTVTISSLYTQVACAAQTVASGTIGFRMAVSGDVIEVDFTQGEVGPVATSPIVNAAASGSRSADVISVSGAVSGSIGQTEGTIYVEFEHTSNTAERRLIALSDGTATNRIFIWAMSNILYAQIQGNSLIIVNPIPSGYNKMAFAYQQNGVSGNLFASINGGAVVSGTSTTYPATINRVAIGSSENAAAGVFQWNNRIRAAALYTTRLTNAELQSLTTL